MCDECKRCTNCEVETKYLIFGTTCSTCRKFERKHGRLPDKSERKIKVKGWIKCKRCKQHHVHHAKGLCINCYNYQRTKHKPRPVDRFTENCLNCEKPLNRSDPEHSQCHGKGMCRLCYQYQWMYGKPRPERLWGKGQYGYCDCGKPANHKIKVPVLRHQEELTLCDDCYAIEQQHNTWYGDGPGKNWKSGKTMWGDD